MTIRETELVVRSLEQTYPVEKRPAEVERLLFNLVIDAFTKELKQRPTGD